MDYVNNQDGVGGLKQQGCVFFFWGGTPFSVTPFGFQNYGRRGPYSLLLLTHPHLTSMNGFFPVCSLADPFPQKTKGLEEKRLGKL